jgi:hypothetical protein
MLTNGRCPPGGRPEAAGWVLGALEPDRALDPEGAAWFGEHLLQCEICRTAVDDLKMTARMLQGTLFKGRPPASLQSRTLARIRQEAGRANW